MATWLRPQALRVRALVLILSSSGLAGPVRAAPPPAAPAAPPSNPAPAPSDAPAPEGAVAGGASGRVAAPVTAPSTVRPAQPSAAPARQARREQAREEGFEAMEDQALPMTAGQLQTLIQSLETIEAVSAIHREPETVMGAAPLQLDASRPPVVRVGQGYGTSILFTDRTGKAWPITAYQGFNESLFVVSASTTTGNKEDLPSVLVVQPVASRGAGNLVVTLKGLETPVVLTLVLGQKTVDARKEFKLPLAGPNAAVEYHAVSPAGIETALLNVLNGLPPVASAKRIAIRGAEPEAMAWRTDDALYLRTVAEIYSPEYGQRASNPSGLRAYKLPDVPVLLASFNGNLTEIVTEE